MTNNTDESINNALRYAIAMTSINAAEEAEIEGVVAEFNDVFDLDLTKITSDNKAEIYPVLFNQGYTSLATLQSDWRVTVAAIPEPVQYAQLPPELRYEENFESYILSSNSTQPSELTDGALKISCTTAGKGNNDFRSGGIALKYLKAGHSVRFLSVCNGTMGHHEMEPEALHKRRMAECQAASEISGIEYDNMGLPECEVGATIENRKKILCYIREYQPDIIFTHRANDYHADHRDVAVLVQDASYLLKVPHFCPEVKALEKVPVIMYFFDTFDNPPFRPSGNSEYREATPAVLYREKIVERYGEKARRTLFAETFQCSPYGTKLTKENIDKYFPF